MAEILLQDGAAPTATGSVKIDAGRVNLAHFVSDVSAPLTLDKGFALSDRQKGNKEEGEIEIATCKISLAQATIGTDAWMVLDAFFSWANAAYKNHFWNSFCSYSFFSRLKPLPY